MGVDAGDVDLDGDEDLFMTHLRGETNTLYVNDGSGLFEDRSAGAGLGSPSLGHTGFGAAWVDVDNDTWLDLFVVNGAVAAMRDPGRANDPFPYGQPNQVFRNLGGGRFEELTDRAGAAVRLSDVSRGAAFGDVDNDGDVDVLVNNTRTRAAVHQRRRQSQPLDRVEAGRRPRSACGRARHARRPRRDCPPRAADALAACAGRRQLRLGQRSAGPGGARQCGRRSGRSRHLAERSD